MSADLWTSIVDTAQQQAPLLVTIAVLTATYLYVQRISKTGRCPFAEVGGGGTKAAAAGAAAPAGAQQQQGQQPAMTEGVLRLTRQQLQEHDGRDASKPLYIAVRGRIYDVSAGRSFYGPGGPYAVFAGKECARALAFMKITPEDCSDDLEGATEAQLQTLADWEAKFRSKYGVAGRLVA